MAASAPEEDTSPSHPAVKTAANRWAKLAAQLKRFRGPIVAIAAFGAILSGFLGYWNAYQTVDKVVANHSTLAVDAADAGRAAPRYSIAILPFATATGSPTDEQFAAALTNDLTMAVGLDHRVPVVSHSLAVRYKGNVIDARAVGRELNVRYLVQGEVRRADERLTVNAQLIDTGNATQLWSDHLEFDQAQLTQDPPSLVALLTRRVRKALYNDQFRRDSAPLPPKPTAEDLAAHANAVYSQSSCVVAADCLKAILEARKMFDQALRLNPNVVDAMIGRAETLNDELWINLRADHDALVRGLEEVSNRAVSAAPNDPETWQARAGALLWQWRWPAALEATTKASSLNPTSPSPFVVRAWIMVHIGRPAEALLWMDRASALDPNATGLFILMRCRAYQALGRYDDAIATCERSVVGEDYWIPHAYLVAAYAQKGETAKAEAEKMILVKEQPGITIADLKALRLSNEPAYLQQTETHLYAGLRKAGIPEQ